jgi:hypothetical protein
MPTPKEALKAVILEFLERLQPSSGMGHSGHIPEFDYYPMDYLEFAELNLNRYFQAVSERDKENELIACLSNLKRALDCQIECFLESWNLREECRKNNLGLDKKLSFLAEAGLFSSRTIRRFTEVRNRFEHDFQKPQIQDLESLYDLVQAFVAILQNAMSSGFQQEVEMEIWDENENVVGDFSLCYDSGSKSFTAQWKVTTDPPREGSATAALSSPQDFAYFFRVLYLLTVFYTFPSYDYIRAKLDA